MILLSQNQKTLPDAESFNACSAIAKHGLLLGNIQLFDDRTNLCRYYRCGTVEESHLTSTNNRRGIVPATNVHASA